MEQDGLEARHDADLVRGKGKGLIILLHGAPGVGKTSTAETVADAFGKLLFPITCGDLGLTAADVERELSQKFHLAELWGCVLLLDEADVFLARRTNTDIKRNSSVSVFLRVLEHFTGVLFLTTNRVGAFDEAFKSRIHLSLYYPPLDAEQTRNIWKVNLERLIKKKQRRHESMLFDEKEILAYAQNHYTRTIQRGASWNGRQIRNAFQTASSLAEFEAHEQNTEAKARSAVTGEKFVRCDPHLRVGHFKEIAKASYEFDKYISETKGFTDAEIAYREGQRMDEYQAYRSPVRDREKQLKQSRETSTLLSAPMQGPGPQLKARRAPTAQASAGRIGSVYPRSPVAFTQDIPEAQASEHDQRPARTETRSVNTYGTPTTIARTGDKRSSAAHSRPKTSQQQSTLMAQDQERQQYEVLDEYATQYNDGHEDGEDLEYEPSYENPSSQPMNTRIHFDDRNQRQTSPRHRQFGDFPTRSQKSAFFDYGDNLEDDEDNFDG